VIPARQTWVITTLLRETTAVLAPARLISAQLQSGLADEMATLQSYALSGDSAALRRHAVVVAENDRRLASLEVLSAQLDGPFRSHVASVRERVTAWRALAPAATTRQRDRDALVRALLAGQPQLDASRAAVTELSTDLSAEALARDHRVGQLEHYSLGANATMVIAAFAALYAVLVLTLRERRLAGSLRRRVEEESARARAEKALREAAEALAGAFSIDEVTQRIAQAALEADDAERAAVFGHLAALAYARVQLLEEAVEGRRRLQLVITSRSRLIRGFSHDVKNPIGAADGYAELLSEGVYGTLTSEQRESLVRMRRCLRSALALIDDLHELARAETGHLEITSEAVDLTDLLRRLGEEYQATAEGAGLRLTVSVALDVPPIRSSRTRVRQIASNLLSNAIKYTDAGSVTVTVTRRVQEHSDDGAEWVLIEVADTGRGIPPDKLDYVFQEFGRVAGNDAPGAGLGLAISRLLAQALGGRITVTSEVGRGSTFTLWLPLVHDTGATVPAGALMPGDARAASPAGPVTTRESAR
jgi:signal transduction histidine kinase